MEILPESNFYFSKNCNQLDVDFGQVIVLNEYLEEDIEIENNMFNLLFSDTIAFNTIVTTFSEKYFNDITSEIFKRRLSPFKDLKIWYSNENGDNILNLTQEEILHLNLLLDWKLNQNDNLSQFIDISNLSLLSKLIYTELCYLINGDIITEYLYFDINENDMYEYTCKQYSVLIIKKILNHYKFSN